MTHISSGVLLTFSFCRGHSDQRQPVASQRSHSYKEAELRWKPCCSDSPTSKPLPFIPPSASAVVGIGMPSPGLGSVCQALRRLQLEWGGMQTAGLPARLLSQACCPEQESGHPRREPQTLWAPLTHHHPSQRGRLTPRKSELRIQTHPAGYLGGSVG